ncbi:U3 small nucleolar RNA-associated protein 20 [Fistulifera solaris]|uniref:U3 small nucleolar RNA-associated protein 20 n=1 Tax=Fistulifera solaris TaxID=1519565 RepID=A0A1Z5JBQ9_FISSO|nr:U3 small nucleolar RNA-associated protein 20 [Fistulifera solaris]|eukprot:GAX11440.1 U3 small nucleolar RNA-associated protein 20 [Fistulifera solaris]
METTKTFNQDGRSKTRLRFASSRKRAKSASADIYRNYKRRYGVTTAAVREEQVHSKRKDDEKGTEDSTSTLAEELDIAMDRNASEVFGRFYREIWHLVRSLPEVLHHAEAIVDILNKYLLSPDEDREEARSFSINHATTDILHLYAVFARDMRHEIHKFLHTKILPRFLDDLLYPSKDQQQRPMDVTVVEAVFRTLSYIFRYDCESIVSDGDEPCLEQMRQYYGRTLAHRRELVRRLSAETFAPLIRKLKSDSARKRHLKRVLKALAAADEPRTEAAKRLQEDAIDGISQLLFQVCRGPSGKLHSKGNVVIKCALDCVGGAMVKGNLDLLKNVVSAFLSKLFTHLKGEEARQLVLDVVRVSKTLCTENLKELNKFPALLHVTELLSELVQARMKRGEVGREEKSLMDQLISLLDRLLANQFFTVLPPVNQKAVIRLLCDVWKMAPEFCHRDGIGKQLCEILVESCSLGAHPSEDSPFGVIVRDLISELPREVAMRQVGSLVLSASTRVSKSNGKMASAMVHSLLTSRCKIEGEMHHDDDRYLFLENAQFCCLSSDDKQQLLNVFMNIKSQEGFFGKDDVEAAIAAQTSCFACLVPESATQKSDIFASYKNVADWLTLNIEKAFQRAVGSQLPNRFLNLTIEAFGCLAYQACCLLGQPTIVKAALDRINQVILDCLKYHPRSLLTLKSVSSIVRAGRECGHAFSSDTEMLFDLLIPNLQHESHFIRQHSLEILASLQKKPFVVNHSDLDLSGDLDEEPSTSNTGTASSKGPVGICHIIDALLEIETTKLCLQNERHICSLVSKVEVNARSGKLPVVYAEAASSHMLGVLNFKFSPLWSACIKALVTLLKVHSKYSWPFLWNVLSSRVRVVPNADRQQEPGNFQHENATTNPHAFIELCSRWDESSGRDFQLFSANTKTASDTGNVSRHLRTDNLTVLQSLWGVFEEYPDLWIQHSRELVPLVIEFLQLQYFANSPRDPDARELKLFDHLSAKNVMDVTSSIDRHAVVSHLKMILKALALVRGPQQLVKHELLFSIHSKLVGHPDYAIADLALSCIQRYKPAALSPYDEHLRKLLSKGKLREGLLELRSADEDGNIATEHRADLLACLSRILFGRLSAKATSGSSKDSPGARRNAIMSFLSSMFRTFEERSIFVNLMIRPYISDWETNPVSGLREEKDLLALQKQVESSSLSVFEHLPVPVHQGFLNTLGAVITHFGQSARPFIPLFLTLVLKVCSLYEIGEISIDQNAELNNGECDLANWNEDEHEARPIEKTGQIRALCYRRLSEIFHAYDNSIDVSCFSENIWRTLDKALQILPRMGVIADKAPALLGLLRTISSQSNMVVLLEHHKYAVQAVIDCIDAASSASTIDHCLSFIENLLCNDQKGVALVEMHAVILLTRFQTRLNDTSLENRKAYWFRELKVLCRVSELIKFDVEHDKVIEIGQRICVLLTPYLFHGSRCSNDAKENIVSILKRFSDVLSEETAEKHYQELAKVFGPSKGGVGTMSKGLRLKMAHLVVSLTNGSCQAAKPAADVLVNLNKLNDKRVDEIDTETVILTLSALGDVENPVSWKNLCRTEDGSVPFLILPVVNCCFFHLYCEDGVVARTSFRALKILVEVSIDMVKSSGCKKFQKLLEGCFVPHCRMGIASQNAAVRKFFILLIRELAGLAVGLCSANLHGDLMQLIRDDEPDLDFFLAITHVQIHRRAKAFQRLRNDLLNDDGACRFTAQSLSHILLPIAMHPAYEATSKVDSALALEGAATVGALARHLSWSKYNEVLWTTLNQFQRHPNQETYLTGVICSLLDAFHFSTAAEDSNDSIESQNAVQRALYNRILPKLEELLTKDVVDSKGNKSKTLRPSIVLAMVKLFKKLSLKTLESRLPRLLTVVCDALKGRDIKIRDLGRETLAKVAAEIGMKYLADITRELALALKEGYRLHVRAAALHSVILKLSSVYVPTEIIVGQDRPHFDSSVIALMDLIQQDLFGVAQERKDADNAVSYVQEAVGSKSYHSIELIASMITFDPTSSSLEEISSIHALVTPFLEKLRVRNSSNNDVKRAKECLSRIVIGLNKNPSVVPKSVLPFVYATLQPFLEGRCAGDVVKDTYIDFDQSEENDASLKGGMVVEWNPTSIGTAKSAGEAKEAKASRLREDQHVQDGYNAPKLTGSDRHVNHLQSTTFDDHKANTHAVGFGLRILHSTLKKRKSFAISGEILDPFVGWLSYCYCRSRDSDIVLLSLKCLGLLLDVDLPSLQNCSRALASKTLELLTSAGPSSSVDPDLLQSSFKMLTYLLTHKKKFSGRSSSFVPDKEPGKSEDLSHSPDLPLNASQMEVLISFLKASLADSEQHTPAMGLVKTILSRRYIAPEIYDLAETLLELTVRSNKVSLREQSASAVVSFLINYPLSDERVEQHLQQILLNLQYEYSDGRLSGCRLLSLVIEAFPSAVIERHVETIFLPLALQLGNEENKECRQLLTKCVSRLLQRVTPEIVQKLFTYVLRWSHSSDQLQLLAAKMFIIFMDYQDGFLLKKDDQASRFVDHMHDIVSSTNDWQPRYFAILAIEKLFTTVPNTAAKATAVWKTLVQNLGTEKNAWIKIASSRIIYGHLQTLSPTSFADSGVTSFLLEWPGALFQLVRNLCFHLGAPEEEQNDELVTCTVNCLTWCLQAMNSFPNISYSDKVMALSDEDSTDEKEDDKNRAPKRHPATWLLTRLSNIAKLPGTKRRQAVYKCFGSFASADAVFTSNPYLLELVLTPLNRSMMEYRNSELPVGSFTTSTASNEPRPDAQLAQEVWELFEEKIPSAAFVSVMNTVQSRAIEKAAKRKEKTKAEYVLDPAKAAEQRIKKHEREKERRKRKVDERRRAEGRSAKRRHGID